MTDSQFLRVTACGVPSVMIVLEDFIPPFTVLPCCLFVRPPQAGV